MVKVIYSELGHISRRIGDHIPVRRHNVYNGGGRYVCKRCFRSVKGTLFLRAADEAAARLGKRSGYHLFFKFTNEYKKRG